MANRTFPIIRGIRLIVELDDSLSGLEIVRRIKRSGFEEIYAKGPESINYSIVEKFIERIKRGGLEYTHESCNETRTCSLLVDSDEEDIPLNRKKCRPGFVTEIEGFHVYFRHPKMEARTLSAGVIRYSPDYVYINVNGPYSEYSVETVISFVEQRFEDIINYDITHRLKYSSSNRAYSSVSTRCKAYIDKSSFLYVNPRNDIIDDDPVKIMKRKWKSSMIDPVYSSPYVGPKDRPKAGDRIISPDGRFTTFNGSEEKFREQD